MVIVQRHDPAAVAVRIRGRDFLYISNILSIFRLLLAAPITFLIKINTPSGNLVLIILIIVAMATDYLDGYLGRRLGQATDLGKILDPLADKILMAAAMIALIFYRDFPPLLVILLVYRDILILVLGYIVILKSRRMTGANLWGKVNSWMVSIACLIFLFSLSRVLFNVTYAASVATTVISGVSYYLIGERAVFEHRRIRYLFRFLLFLVTSLLVLLLFISGALR
jgi:CDP-diacylglycerol--glycerol-3-phosphate 3-phosphatidyltransferase